MLAKNILKAVPLLSYYKEYMIIHDVSNDERDLIFAQKDFHMTMQFFVRPVCKFGLPVTRAIKTIEQVKIVSNVRIWVSNRVEKNCFSNY